MTISEIKAQYLEDQVRRKLVCDYNGYGGLVTAANIANHPLEMAALCVGALYHKSKTIDFAISEFFSFWNTVFDYPQENTQYNEDDFVAAFDRLLKSLD